MADLHGFVTKIITSVSGFLEEGKVGICKETSWEKKCHSCKE